MKVVLFRAFLVSILVSLLMVTFAAGWVTGRVESRLPSGFMQNGDAYQTYYRIEKAWKSNQVESDGWIRGCPVEGMVAHGELDCSHLAHGATFVHNLPARLNVDLRQNPHLPVFWVEVDGLDEMIYYADGAQEKRRIGRGFDPYQEWEQLLERGGYPRWHSTHERTAWIEANKDRLVWDPVLHIYVPGPVTSMPATGATGQ